MSYAHPEVLVSTQWVSEHINDPKVRIIEVDYDPESAYEQGHIQNAVLAWWKRDINDPVARDIISKEQFEQLMSRFGVNNDTTLVLYGDFNNWFAAFAFWVFKYYGHEDVRIMNGGRKKWELENRPYTKEVPSFPQTNYKIKAINEEFRAYYDEVRNVVEKKDPNYVLVDVRSPKEYTGEITAPPEYPMEHAQRGGHIPGAKNIPWAKAVNEDGTFKSPEELRKLYESQGITPDKNVIAYCRIGERSSHTWFVLKYLLGYPKVKNYDGSWTEWGNMIRNPIEK
ncbi:MAG: sulfurtransferase [Candidatus Nitrosothermus koennekii]|nr:MAG: sulfurtransferase [Candidatus Nitrosothermus koennekii]